MAASNTLPEVSPSLNSETIVPHRGIVTLFGYGISVRVERGHLVLLDGIGAERREGRLPRVGHGLRRLVVIGSDGMVSLAALRWLHDQKAAFVMLERNGKILTAAGPSGPRDARLRRAQAVASLTGAAVAISRVLLDRKLQAQEGLAADRLHAMESAAAIASERSSLPAANTIEDLRWIEARAALAYWSAWHDLPILFPKNSLARVPNHWRTFGARRSPLTGSPRLAVNPASAMLNYLYALLESEARLAAVAVGLDPSVGILHADTDARDSLACDLMEPIRPRIDAYVLDWLTREALRREWFFEERDGNCRLVGAFANQLAETMPTWARALAPVAEHVAQMLGDTIHRARPRPDRRSTPLTQRHRREAKGIDSTPDTIPPSPPTVCRGCGSVLERGRQHCRDCHGAALSETFTQVMARGRMEAHRPAAQARRAATQRRHGQARSAWRDSDQPDWLTAETYVRDIQPRLATLTTVAIAGALGVSVSYAAQIRAGARRPHPRHWLALALLAGRTGSE